MDDKTLHVLEYDKIRELLARECSSSLTEESVKNIMPLHSSSEVREALTQTEEAYTVLMKKGMPPLGHFDDIGGLAHLAAMDGVLNNKQLLDTAYNLQAARRTAVFLSSDLPPLPGIDSLVSAISILKNLENEIYRCIISEDDIADDASPELKHIRKDIIRQNENIKNKLIQIVNSAENKLFLQDSIVTRRQGRYVVPVKLEHKQRLPGIVHDQSSSGATLFIEPAAIVNMNNELRELELKERDEIARILRELSSLVGQNEAQIKANQRIMTSLDFSFAKGRLALGMKASRPGVSHNGLINIRRGRHPLIDPEKVVPINVGIGGDLRTLIITGPNTGGKTVTLKTIGLLSLMAQSGLFVPAGDGTVFPVFKNIYADIGDEQSIEQSLSTFSSHMNNIVRIVGGAGNNSLVLVDELGAGTDPAEGAALAMSILDFLYKQGALTAATTHYTELKKYAISKDGVQNASMEFDVETLSPTYRLIVGTPGKSNAFEISQKLGLKSSIIDHAKTLLEAGDIAFEDVLTKLERDRKEAEDKLTDADRLLNEMLAQKQRTNELEAELTEKKNKILQDARDQAKEMLRDAQNEIDEVKNSLKNARISDELKKAVEDAGRSVKAKKNEYSSYEDISHNDEAPDIDDIKIGIRVNVLKIGQKGKVVSLPDKKGNLTVSLGALTVTANINDITIVKENVNKSQKEKTMLSRMRSTKSMTIASSVNVIGKTLDDASLIVEKYIDDAFIAGLETVTLIHGRGAGILRNGIAQLLKKNKHVESFRSGGYKEGGDGVTVVTIKR